MMRSNGKIWAFLVLAGLLALPPALAQDADKPAPATQSADAIARTAFIRQQFQKLAAKMLEVADLLEKTEPATAKIIREAANQANRAFIAENMEEVAELLRKGLEDAAAKSESDVVKKLRDVLTTLLHGVLDMDKRMERLKTLEAFRDKVDGTLKQEKPFEEHSRIAKDANSLSSEAQRLAQTLENIIKEQEKLLKETQGAGGDPVIKKLSDLRNAVRDLIDRQGKASAVTTDPNTAVEKLPVVGKAQDNLASDANAVQGKIGEAAKDSKLTDALSKAGADANAVSGAASSVGQASGEMRNASDSLGKSDAAGAVDPQKNAMADLQAAERALSDAISKAAGATAAGKIGQEQDKLKDKTVELAKAVGDLNAKTGGQGGQPGQGQSGQGQSGQGQSGQGQSGQGQSGQGQSGQGQSGQGQSGQGQSGQGQSGQGQSGQGQSGQGQSGQGQSGQGQSGQKPSGNLNKAAEHMANAADKLAGQDPNAATGDQKAALNELQGKKWELAQLKRRIEEQAQKPVSEEAKDQKNLGEQTAKLADDMKKAADSSGSNTPGQSKVSSASGSMGKASGQMSKNDASSANEDQKKAINDLEQAKNEIEDEIARTKDEMQNESLAQIDQMLQKILDRQMKVSKATKDAYDKRQEPKDKEKYNRPEEIALTTLSQDEGLLAEETQKVRALLTKEGTTVVFPEVLQEVQNDLKNVQKLLADKQAGPYPQTVQEGIERALQDMIDSIRKELAERRKKKAGGGGGQGGGGGGGKQPLVPPIAELKMLLALQKQINTRTTVLDVAKTQGQLPAEKAAKEHKDLADRQNKVKDMTGDINKKMSRGGGGPPGP